MLENFAETIEDEYVSPVLETLRDSNISNFIIHEACKKYFNNFKSKWVPSSFLKFYFEEYNRYSFMSKNFLTPFFEIYKEDDMPALVDHYYHSHYSVIIGKKIVKSETYYLLTNNYYMDCNLQEPSMLGMFDQLLYSELGKICEHLEESDELVTIKENYEYYLLKKLVLSKGIKVKATVEQQEIIKQEAVNNTVLVGAQTEVPKQTGKVTKIFFPKLNLPSPYPILTDKSRINSEHRIKRILRADKQIDLIGKHRFNGVKYAVAFIEKRKAAKKPTKRKFDFDF